MGFLFLAYGFGVLCALAGVLVMRFGTGSIQSQAPVAPGDVPAIGWGLIGLGVLSTGLCVVIQRTGK